MRIEVWSDFVCPFCYIGKRTLEQALEKFSHKDQVEIVYKSYELQPDLKSDLNVSVDEMLAKKMGMTINQAKEMNKQVIQRAAEAGLKYNFDQMKQTNTLDAHRLAKYAEGKGKGAELTERILKAHFTEFQFIGSHETLINLAAEVGLDREESQKVLEGKDYLEEVRAEEAEAAQIRIQGVPFFVLNRKYAISGAQPIGVFINALEKVWEEENQFSPLQPIQSKEGLVCKDDNCEVPVD
ncbi:DsbA family oxidoreductase [Heyndrickxia acidicola]|uniref:DsbA family oxidoreductase n=1 Tax=Heyndrickxia acidicola TaxID=209389 RepID=A0ABU6MKM3_9BACI|nr:DsbA family oxidoreductase [Heyndrickxia acidicola]MED1203792.1 DsbA family oxidoreductase [Heyndrickxia acidicola]